MNPTDFPVVYISGPMTGIKDHNYPAFIAAAQKLRRKGYLVFNPAENFGGDRTKPYLEYLRCDIRQVAQSQAVVVLEGYENSRGARAEIVVARLLEIPVFSFGDYSEITEHSGESVLQEAQRLVHGDRGDDYGSPLNDFSRTAKIWGAILGVTVEPEQVGLCMVGVKISRQCNRPKRDNLVDAAGYCETVSMVIAERGRI